jgi:hypothetical protein
MQTANVVANVLVINQSAVVEGVTCLVVDCEDFMTYKGLPQALEFQGVICGRSGWNSDKSVAYYQSNVALAAVRR